MTEKKERYRCGWAGKDELYQHYHDTEWGVPQPDDNALFEKICLEGFQAGLSWITILKKREHFRKVFDGFDAKKIIKYNDKKIAKLIDDPGIVRNKLKINATITNARAFLDLQEKQSLASFLWGYVDGTPIQNQFNDLSEIPAETDISKQISTDLKKLGFKFCGPTIVYAMMQSIGMVNDHVLTCPDHARCKKLAKKFKAPTN